MLSMYTKCTQFPGKMHFANVLPEKKEEVNLNRTAFTMNT